MNIRGNPYASRRTFVPKRVRLGRPIGRKLPCAGWPRCSSLRIATSLRRYVASRRVHCRDDSVMETRWLIGARIAKGWSLSRLADELDVSVQQVSRDEQNEYEGITTRRAQRILDALGVRFQLEVEEPIREDESDLDAVAA